MPWLEATNLRGSGVRVQGLVFRVWLEATKFELWPKAPISGLWLAGNERLEKTMKTTVVGYIGTTIGIHSFIPS